VAARRFDDLSKAIGRPFRSHRLLIVVAFVLAGLGAAAAARVTSREVAIVLGAAILVGSIAGYRVWFAQSRYAPGVEALGDHELLERRAWRQATGTGMPRTRRRARRWLAEHPLSEATARWRLGLSLWTDDLVSARDALASLYPETPEERFVADRERATLSLLEGGMPDLEPARAAAAALTDPAERRHARVCFALLKARYEVATGADPWPPILAARADLSEIAPTVTMRWLSVRLAAVLAIAVTLSLGLALLIR
jgi:hypothetical protein